MGEKLPQSFNADFDASWLSNHIPFQINRILYVLNFCFILVSTYAFTNAHF
jgi:hypothetical protein